ncbi:hypothetical protein ACKFKG_30050 [Phormidesmis sp. 146-35]
MLITLSDLRKLQPSGLDDLFPSPFSALQDHLQLVIQQLHLNLPAEPLLQSDPALHHLVCEVQAALPNALCPGKRLQLNYPIAALLDGQIYVRVEVNVGFRQGQPKLFEWAIRQPHLTWSDRVKLWVTTKHFEMHPNDVTLIVVALHPNQSAQKIVLHWNAELHEQTERWLFSLLSESCQPIVPIPSASVTCSNEINVVLKNLEAVEEVPI